MFKKHNWFLMAPADGGGGGGGGGDEPKFDAPAARTFMTSYGHNADSLKGMADAEVLKLAEPVWKSHTENSTKLLNETLEKAKGEWSKAPQENWRELAAGGDAKKLEALKRFTSYDAYSKAFFDAQETIRTGAHKKPAAFPEKGTADEQAAWRKELGIPTKPEEYDTKLENGIVIGETDKPLVDQFLKHAHAGHAAPAEVKRTLQWFFGEYQPAIVKQMETERATQLAETKKALMTAWGADYEPNRNAVIGLLDSRVKGDSKMKQLVINAVDTDPEFAELLAGVAREINPVHTPGGQSGDMPAAVQSELAELTKLSGDHSSKYWVGAEAAKLQERMRELLEWKERDDKRKAQQK